MNIFKRESSAVAELQSCKPAPLPTTCYAAAEDTRGDAVDLATVGPLRLEVVSVEPGQQGQASVLVEVTAECGGPGNTPGLSTIDGWPVRCAHARHSDPGLSSAKQHGLYHKIQQQHC